MNVELSAEECDLLYEVVDSAFRDLKMEIGSTDTPAYKRQLKARERVLASLRLKLEPAVPV